MVHVLLLLLEEVRGDGVERVGAQLVLALDDGQQVELYAALDGDLLRLALAVRLRRERGVAHAHGVVAVATEVREFVWESKSATRISGHAAAFTIYHTQREKSAKVAPWAKVHCYCKKRTSDPNLHLKRLVCESKFLRVTSLEGVLNL